MLCPGTKHLLPFILATQSMDALKESVKNAVITNTANKIIFRSNAKDAALLAKQVGNEFTADDVTLQPRFEAIATILTPTGPSGPVSIHTRDINIKPGTSQAGFIRKLSQEKCGRNRAVVEREIAARYVPEQKPEPKRHPRVSGWDDDLGDSGGFSKPSRS
jgi:hypothetical protein